jgi:hypothetical protein
MSEAASLLFRLESSLPSIFKECLPTVHHSWQGVEGGRVGGSSGILGHTNHLIRYDPSSCRVSLFNCRKRKLSVQVRTEYRPISANVVYFDSEMNSSHSHRGRDEFLALLMDSHRLQLWQIEGGGEMFDVTLPIPCCRIFTLGLGLCLQAISGDLYFLIHPLSSITIIERPSLVVGPNYEVVAVHVDSALICMLDKDTGTTVLCECIIRKPASKSAHESFIGSLPQSGNFSPSARSASSYSGEGSISRYRDVLSPLAPLTSSSQTTSFSFASKPNLNKPHGLNNSHKWSQSPKYSYSLTHGANVPSRSATPPGAASPWLAVFGQHLDQGKSQRNRMRDSMSSHSESTADVKLDKSPVHVRVAAVLSAPLLAGATNLQINFSGSVRGIVSNIFISAI